MDLFTPLTLRDLTFANRLWIAPMCQYSVDAEDGVPTDWHLVNLGAFAQGGFGLVTTEATAVSPEGRISPRDTGLWNDEQLAAWRRITEFIHARGTLAGIQLAHAGRKASTWPALPGFDRGTVPEADGGWPTVAPSAVAFPGYAVPAALDDTGLAKVVADFRAAAERSIVAGFDVLEVHGAHGYLLHEFLSPLSNQRTDEYGGSLENRARLLLQVVDAIREVWDGVLFVRLSATDWVEGGLTGEETVQVARMLREHAVDLVDVSSGGNQPADIPIGPGYQVHLAEQVRSGSGIPTSAVGLITEAAQANDIVASGRADAVRVARVALRQPHWPQLVAHELGIEADLFQPQHVRAALR